MQNLIPAMDAHRITRIVTLTGSGAASPTKKSSPLHTSFMKILSPLPAGRVFADGEEHMRVLMRSDLAWTTLRSPVMTNGRNGEYELSMRAGNHLLGISRKAVANALLDQLGSQDWICQAPIIHHA
jgi:hypothetical protein